MNKEQINEMRLKIIQGLDLAYKRLLKEKKKEDGYLVISKNGKIIKVQARDLP